MNSNDKSDEKFRLKETLRSSVTSKTVYGLKGDDVTLISVYGHICIVENELGNRFSVPLENLSGNIIDKDAATDAAVQNKQKTKRAPVSRIKEEPINQTQLF